MKIEQNSRNDSTSKVYRNFFQQGSFPDFAHYGLSALIKLIDAIKNMIFLLILIEFMISESLKAILKFQKILPLGGAGVARPSPWRGAVRRPEGSEFFKNSESLSHFQIL